MLWSIIIKLADKFLIKLALVKIQNTAPIEERRSGLVEANRRLWLPFVDIKFQPTRRLNFLKFIF